MGHGWGVYCGCLFRELGGNETFGRIDRDCGMLSLRDGSVRRLRPTALSCERQAHWISDPPTASMWQIQNVKR